MGMLKPLIGSKVREQVLIFVYSRGGGYAREIARFFDSGVYPVRLQLDRLEGGGIFVSREEGRTRIYSFNPRYPFLKELESLLEKVLSFYPDDIREKLILNRRRPRRRGKPL
jgi:predicted transcriptional regulator